jgi:putative RNA ligase
MVHVSPAIDLDAINRLVEQRYISVQRHPRLDLHIYNYTPRAQFDRRWTPETRICRGLILDGRGAVVQRPFPKFFNLEEHDGPLPDEPFEVYDKLDGSLGILHWADDGPALATRGSFTSEQAHVGTRILRERYGHAFGRLNRALTYLFEIIFPQNRIVVDYGDTEDLILLAAIETASGHEIVSGEVEPLLVDGTFPRPKRYNGIADVAALAALAEDNREGFVVHFPRSGLRLKVKFAEYVRLHRLITGVTERHIWERLRDGLPIEKFLPDHAPASYQVWVRASAERFAGEYARIDAACVTAFAVAPKDGDRKAFAAYATACELPAILFKMLDGQPYDEIIWKLLRPVRPRAFKVEV